MSDELQEHSEDFIVNLDLLSERRMIVIKVLDGGDIHGEDNEGQMVIVRPDGSVSSFLHGDEDWVHGECTVGDNGKYWEGSAWDVIGYHLGMTDGERMERARNGTIN